MLCLQSQLLVEMRSPSRRYCQSRIPPPPLLLTETVFGTGYNLSFCDVVAQICFPPSLQLQNRFCFCDVRVLFTETVFRTRHNLLTLHYFV